MADKDYERDAAEFKRLDSRSAQGDRAAKRDKNVVRQRMREAEREAADKGVILDPGTGKAAADTGITKYDLQTERLAKYREYKDVPVKMKNRDGTEYVTDLYSYHKKMMGR